MLGAGLLLSRPLPASAALCAIMPSLALAARATPRTRSKASCKRLTGGNPPSQAHAFPYWCLSAELQNLEFILAEGSLLSAPCALSQCACVPYGSIPLSL